MYDLNSLLLYFRYLQKCCLDEELLSLKRFDEYRPVDCPLERVDIDTDTGTAPKQEPTFPTAHQHMVRLHVGALYFVIVEKPMHVDDAVSRRNDIITPWEHVGSDGN